MEKLLIWFRLSSWQEGVEKFLFGSSPHLMHGKLSIMAELSELVDKHLHA